MCVICCRTTARASPMAAATVISRTFVRFVCNINAYNSSHSFMNKTNARQSSMHICAKEEIQNKEKNKMVARSARNHYIPLLNFVRRITNLCTKTNAAEHVINIVANTAIQKQKQNGCERSEQPMHMHCFFIFIFIFLYINFCRIICGESLTYVQIRSR